MSGAFTRALDAEIEKVKRDAAAEFDREVDAYLKRIFYNPDGTPKVFVGIGTILGLAE